MTKQTVLNQLYRGIIVSCQALPGEPLHGRGMMAAMAQAAKEGGGSTSMKLEDIVIKLQMAYLYISKKGENSVLEYAFQLQVVTEGLVPETIKPIVDVTNLSISVWNTDRKKVVDKMALITVDEYLGAAALPDKSQAAK